MHRFVKGKPCLSKIIAFYKEMIGSVDERRAMDIVYLDFSKALDNLSHRCLLQDKLRNYALDKWTTVRWIESWLNCQAHRAVKNLFLELLNAYSGNTHTYIVRVWYTINTYTYT